MRVSYKKQWKLLIDKDMNKADLRRATGLSSFTVAKMARGENCPALMRLWAAQRAVEKKAVQIDYCANGHGQIHGDWCDEKKCHVCDAPIVGSCKLPLVDKDYA